MLFLSTTARIKKVLKDSMGAAVTGLTDANFSGGNIFLYKADGTKVTIALTLGVNLFETDSTDAPGLYEFVIPGANLNQEGPLAISFQPDTTDFEPDFYVDTVDLGINQLRTSVKGASTIDNTQIYNRIGAPVAASISADVANAITNIKGLSNLSTTDLGGSIFNPALDNLHAIKQAINGVPTGIAGAVWDELTAGHVAAGTYGEFFAIISAIFLNRVKIDYVTKTLIVYQADNVTPLKTYSLYDQFLNPATLNATERAKAI